ncbi:MAG: hypothetical protein ACKVUS_10575 [Saprospiraceae bacterium]
MAEFWPSAELRLALAEQANGRCWHAGIRQCKTPPFLPPFCKPLLYQAVAERPRGAATFEQGAWAGDGGEGIFALFLGV